MKNYLAEAIWKLRPSAEFVITDNDYSTIKWHVLEGVAPTQTEIDTTIDQIKNEEILKIESEAIEKSSILAQLGITQDQIKLLLS